MNIKELAEQAGICESITNKGVWIAHAEELERFAELVAEQTHTNNKAKWYQEGYEAGQRDEREACAKVCEDASHWDGHIAIQCAQRIRARGDKHD